MMHLEGRASGFFVVLVVMLTLAVVAMALRVFVRVRLVNAFGLDDYLMVIATLAFIMFTTCALGGIRYGTGRHMVDLTAEDTMKALRYWWLCYIAYTSTMLFAKMSIGFFLLRVTVYQAHVWIIRSAMAITAVTGVIFFFVTLLQCNPVSFFWTKAVGGKGTCVDIEVIIGLTYFYSTISALCDFTFGILPIFMLWNLNMSRKTKIAVAPILSMACIASAGLLVRTAYVKDFRDPDFLYATVYIAVWSDVEEGLAITAGSLACLRPLFRLVTTKVASYSFGTKDRSGSNPRSGSNQPEHMWPESQENKPRPAKGNCDSQWSILQTESPADDHGDYEMHAKEPAADARSVETKLSDAHSVSRIWV